MRVEPAVSRAVRPTLTLFCGLPGSGKTTLARRLEAQGRGIRLCTDDWQAELQVPATDAVFHGLLQSALYRHAGEMLRHGVDVILEDGLWMRAERAEKFEHARAMNARIELHVFDVPLETLWSRLQGRNAGAARGTHPMSRDDLSRAWALFEAPSEVELTSVDRYWVHRAEPESPTDD